VKSSKLLAEMANRTKEVAVDLDLSVKTAEDASQQHPCAKTRAALHQRTRALCCAQQTLFRSQTGAVASSAPHPAVDVPTGSLNLHRFLRYDRDHLCGTHIASLSFGFLPSVLLSLCFAVPASSQANRAGEIIRRRHSAPAHPAASFLGERCLAPVRAILTLARQAIAATFRGTLKKKSPDFGLTSRFHAIFHDRGFGRLRRKMRREIPSTTSLNVDQITTASSPRGVAPPSSSLSFMPKKLAR